MLSVASAPTLYFGLVMEISSEELKANPLNMSLWQVGISIIGLLAIVLTTTIAVSYYVTLQAKEEEWRMGQSALCTTIFGGSFEYDPMKTIAYCWQTGLADEKRQLIFLKVRDLPGFDD